MGRRVHFDRMASINGSASNGRKSSNFSPTPIKRMGWSCCAITKPRHRAPYRQAWSHWPSPPSLRQTHAPDEAFFTIVPSMQCPSCGAVNMFAETRLILRSSSAARVCSQQRYHPIKRRYRVLALTPHRQNRRRVRPVCCATTVAPAWSPQFAIDRRSCPERITGHKRGATFIADRCASPIVVVLQRR